MTPETDHILLNAIGTLATGVGSEVTTPFGQGQLGLISALLYFSALDFENAADTRARENREMRSLFGEAADLKTGMAEDLRRALRESGEGEDTDLKISTLNAENRDLKTLLIRLHEHLENEAGGEARAVEARLWEFLRRSADARALTLPELA